MSVLAPHAGSRRAEAGPRLQDLTVDHLSDPIALHRTRPRFAWRITDAGSGAVQAGYEIEVLDELTGAVVAATGWIASAQSIAVPVPRFAGQAGSDYRWRVHVLLDGGAALSAEGRFGIAATDWAARWVEPKQLPVLAEGPRTIPEVFSGWAPGRPLGERLRPPQHIRQPFRLPSAPVRARLRSTSQGVHRTTVNGVRVSRDELEPGYESYQHEISVVTHDVTALVRAGENVLGVVLADGWYAGRISMLGRSAQYGDLLRASWELEVRYADGSVERVLPDAGARSSRGPIDWSDLFIGERYDARREIAGWDRPGFDDSGWEPVSLVDVTVPLHPFIGEPVRAVCELPAIDVLHAPNGDVLVDFGQVIAGRVRVRVHGPAGTVVRLEHTEVLDQHGDFFVNIAGVNKEQADEYVLSGAESGEEWEPAFTFHGFRYVRVTGYPAEVTADRFTAVVLSSDLRPTAELRTGDRRLDKLVTNTIWSQRGNFLAVPTDCPQRERAGWTGDVQVFAPTAATLMGVAAFFERWLRNVRLDQLAGDGVVPDIVPMPPAVAASDTPDGSFRADAGWGDVITLTPFALYEHYGDDRFLADNIDAMRAWVAVQTRQAAELLPERLRDQDLPAEQLARQRLLWNGAIGFGDWLAPSTVSDPDEDPIEAIGRAPRLTSELTGPAFQALSLDRLARSADVLGFRDEAEDMRARLREVRRAFDREYVQEDGRIEPHMQGVYVLALAAGLVADERRPTVARQLASLIADAGDHLDTGFVSVPYLLDELWEEGYADLARTLLMQRTPPSWLYEVDMGATTIWESWEAVRPDGTPTVTSMNHYAFGCVVDWMMRRIAGIQLVEPGYRVSRLAPDLDGALGSCAAHVDTPYGRLAIEWTRSAARAAITADVPVGALAELALPVGWTRDASGPLTSGHHTVTATRG